MSSSNTVILHCICLLFFIIFFGTTFFIFTDSSLSLKQKKDLILGEAWVASNEHTWWVLFVGSQWVLSSLTLHQWLLLVGWGPDGGGGLWIKERTTIWPPVAAQSFYFSVACYNRNNWRHHLSPAQVNSKCRAVTITVGYGKLTVKYMLGLGLGQKYMKVGLSLRRLYENINQFNEKKNLLIPKSKCVTVFVLAAFAICLYMNKYA